MLTEQFEFTSNGGIHFKKYSQKNDQGGVDGNSNALIVPVPPDSEGSQGPIYDIKFYFSKRPSNSKCPYLYLKINKNINNYSKYPWYLDTRLGLKSCGFFMKSICTTVGIDIKDRDIVNHSGRSTPITSLFQKGVAMVNHLIEFYARPSNNQKEEAISLLIDSVGTLLSNSQESEVLTKDNAEESIMDLKWLNPNLTKPFRQPLRKTTTMNLLLHINAMKRNPTIGGKQNIRKASHEDEEDNFSEDTAVVSIVKNYYITATHININ
ncbi:42945_t:CDS:2 [Gigaspora margarita]|uniref:42945_t:CDS:1 n=1 Tax=Gigaspora margarita TaxID=4874 RepID=A0ABN7V6J6_GIGMA|nr:42945_t:CDS:2 [Gigaspora margarita]